MNVTRTYTTVETIEQRAIEGLLGRLTPDMQNAVRQNMLWNVRNAIAYEAAQKKELEEVEQFVETVAAKGESWGAW